MSGRKFIAGEYYKRRGDCCDFVYVEQVLFDTGENAEIRVVWYSQLHNGWRRLCTDQFVVGKNNYTGWRQYQPRGKRLYEVGT